MLPNMADTEIAHLKETTPLAQNYIHHNYVMWQCGMASDQDQRSKVTQGKALGRVDSWGQRIEATPSTPTKPARYVRVHLVGGLLWAVRATNAKHRFVSLALTLQEISHDRLVYQNRLESWVPPEAVVVLYEADCCIKANHQQRKSLW